MVVFSAMGGRLPHGPVGIVRSLGRLGVPVHLVSADALAPTAWSRYLTSHATWPIRATSRDEWVERLLALGRRLGGAILIPTDDVGALFASDYDEPLRERFG